MLPPRGVAVPCAPCCPGENKTRPPPDVALRGGPRELELDPISRSAPQSCGSKTDIMQRTYMFRICSCYARTLLRVLHRMYVWGPRCEEFEGHFLRDADPIFEHPDTHEEKFNGNNHETKTCLGGRMPGGTQRFGIHCTKRTIAVYH